MSISLFFSILTTFVSAQFVMISEIFISGIIKYFCRLPIQPLFRHILEFITGQKICPRRFLDFNSHDSCCCCCNDLNNNNNNNNNNSNCRESMAYIFAADSMGLSSFIFVVGLARQRVPWKTHLFWNRMHIGRFWDTASYWLKLRIFPTPLSFNALARVEPFRISGWFFSEN